MKSVSFLLKKWFSLNQLFELAIEPKTKADQDKIGTGLAKLHRRRSNIPPYTDAETGDNVIAGVGELQFDVNVDRLKREFGVEANVGAPQVAYRETITTSGDCEGHMLNNLVVMVNMVMFGFDLNLMQVKDLNSLMLLLVVLFLENISNL